MEDAEPGTLCQYGKGKENRPLPIVGMGLFIDREGIPISMCINPGNTNEQVTMQPLVGICGMYRCRTFLEEEQTLQCHTGQKLHNHTVTKKTQGGAS